MSLVVHADDHLREMLGDRDGLGLRCRRKFVDDEVALIFWCSEDDREPNRRAGDPNRPDLDERACQGRVGVGLDVRAPGDARGRQIFMDSRRIPTEAVEIKEKSRRLDRHGRSCR